MRLDIPPIALFEESVHVSRRPRLDGVPLLDVRMSPSVVNAASNKDICARV